VELTDFKTKEHVDTLEVDAVLVATGRAPYTQVRAVEASLRLCDGHDLGPNEPCMERHMRPQSTRPQVQGSPAEAVAAAARGWGPPPWRVWLRKRTACV
jgi:hypothetical protein